MTAVRRRERVRGGAARGRTAVVVHTAGSPCRCAKALAPILRSLGWRVRLVPVEGLPAGLDFLAGAGVVLEHADTVRGEGWLRAVVRAEAERVGALVAGPSAAAAALCDDKAATAEALRLARVPAPRFAVLRRPGERLPRALRPPFVVKDAFEHGSRGVRPAASRRSAEALAAPLLRGGRPVVVQERVEGREFAVGLLGRPLRALPPVEVLLERDGRFPLYTRKRKWAPAAAGAPRLVPADLDAAEAQRLRGVALRAGRALGLRDYGRIDLRRDGRGRFLVLEANPRPSLEPGTEMVRAAALAGLDHSALVAAIVAAALARGRRA